MEAVSVFVPMDRENPNILWNRSDRLLSRRPWMVEPHDPGTNSTDIRDLLHFSPTRACQQLFAAERTSTNVTRSSSSSALARLVIASRSTTPPVP